MTESVRIRTAGEFAYRLDEIDAAKTVFSENARTKAIIKSCEHARLDERSKKDAAAWIVDNLNPDDAAVLLEKLSTRYMKLEYEDPGVRLTVE